MIKYIWILLLILVMSCQPSQSTEVTTGVAYTLAQYRKAHISDLSYDLSFDIPRSQVADIGARIVISFVLYDNSEDLQIDFKEEREHILDLVVNGEKTTIDFRSEHIVIPKAKLTEGQNHIAIDFIAGNQSLNRNEDYLYTLLVPDRARTVFPLFDQPNLKAIYTLTLAIPADWKAQANGPLVRSIDLGGERKKLEFGTTRPISSYLFAFTAGAYETATSEDGIMTMLYRETDQEKVSRNIPEIFELHKASLDWLEEYTEIEYPFQKFDFALIPSFQYGGMEHVGAIFYNERSLMLDEGASVNRQLRRGSLIAHETAHMWFGDLVTMDWFDDVWLKEVFANFMAAKIVNPSFPEVNHDLRFLLAHYPTAYGIDRSRGSHPIQQDLPNLNNAGTLYGGIIYQKAPIVMRMLERLIGPSLFQEGLQEYLDVYSFDNATWDNLIDIMQKRTDVDLNQWNTDWVKSPGMPVVDITKTTDDASTAYHYQITGEGHLWPQKIAIASGTYSDKDIQELSIQSATSTIRTDADESLVFANYKGEGYGYFKLPTEDISPLVAQINNISDDQERAGQWISLWEELLHGRIPKEEYIEQLLVGIAHEKNPLVLNYISSHVQSLYWGIRPYETRDQLAPRLESIIWDRLSSEQDNSIKRNLYNLYVSIANSENGRTNLVRLWQGNADEIQLPLSDRDKENLVYAISVRDIAGSTDIYQKQVESTSNPDDKKRMTFIKPALSSNSETRASFFNSLKDKENRSQERWVLSALTYLHHPLRQESAKDFVLPSLELLEEIQTTGDIFFPKRWLDNTLGAYRDSATKEVVQTFLSDHPDLSSNLQNKIHQAADMLMRADGVR